MAKKKQNKTASAFEAASRNGLESAVFDPNAGTTYADNEKIKSAHENAMETLKAEAEGKATAADVDAAQKAAVDVQKAESDKVAAEAQEQERKRKEELEWQRKLSWEKGKGFISGIFGGLFSKNKDDKKDADETSGGTGGGSGNTPKPPKQPDPPKADGGEQTQAQKDNADVDSVLGSGDAEVQESSQTSTVKGASAKLNELLQTGQHSELAAALARQAGHAMEDNVSINYVKSLPTWLIKRYMDGEFTPTYADGTNPMKKLADKKQELSELKKQKENALPDDVKRIEDAIQRKNDEISEIKGSKEFKDGRARYTALLANTILTKLINGYSIIKGGGVLATSKASKINDEKLRGALERYNKKYEDVAAEQAKLLGNSAEEQQDAYVRLQRWLSDAALRPYVINLNLQEKRALIDFEKQYGANLTLQDVMNIAKFQMGTKPVDTVSKAVDKVL